MHPNDLQIQNTVENAACTEHLMLWWCVQLVFNSSQLINGKLLIALVKSIFLATLYQQQKGRKEEVETLPCFTYISLIYSN